MRFIFITITVLLFTCAVYFTLKYVSMRIPVIGSVYIRMGTLDSPFYGKYHAIMIVEKRKHRDGSTWITYAEISEKGNILYRVAKWNESFTEFLQKAKKRDYYKCFTKETIRKIEHLKLLL